MSRTHTLVEFRLVEYQLAQALINLSKCKEQPDYQLDMEFLSHLKSLMIEFGFTAKQVVSLLLVRHRFSTREFNPLLDLIATTRDDKHQNRHDDSSLEDESGRPGARSRIRESSPA